MAYTTAELTPMSTHDWRTPPSVTVTWRVTKWEATQDARWKLVAVCEYPNGDWLAALAAAREWFQHHRDEVEDQRIRIKVDPVNAG